MTLLSILERIGLVKVTVEYDYNAHCLVYEKQLQDKRMANISDDTAWSDTYPNSIWDNAHVPISGDRVARHEELLRRAKALYDK